VRDVSMIRDRLLERDHTALRRVLRVLIVSIRRGSDDVFSTKSYHRAGACMQHPVTHGSHRLVSRRYFVPLDKISMIKYAFQALIYNEYVHQCPVKCTPTFGGPPCSDVSWHATRPDRGLVICTKIYMVWDGAPLKANRDGSLRAWWDREPARAGPWLSRSPPMRIMV
jgi:hypothetical protein